MPHRAVIAFLVLPGVGPAAEPPPRAAAAPGVVRVDEETLRIGEITFRPASREIRIPARVNMTDGLIEYALVHSTGKVHESLLVTEASATHLNVALRLLRYRPSPELFPLFEDDGSLSNRFPDVPADLRAAARARITVEWNDEQRTRSVPLHEWIGHAVTERAMPPATWIYGGSYVHGGRFVAETRGDLIAIFVNRDALFNYAGTDNDDDEVWRPMHGRVPAEGTQVTVAISPPGDQAATTNQP